jgi:hypothetical protein
MQILIMVRVFHSNVSQTLQYCLSNLWMSGLEKSAQIPNLNYHTFCIPFHIGRNSHELHLLYISKGCQGQSTISTIPKTKEMEILLVVKPQFYLPNWVQYQQALDFFVLLLDTRL